MGKDFEQTVSKERVKYISFPPAQNHNLPSLLSIFRIMSGQHNTHLHVILVCPKSHFPIPLPYLPRRKEYFWNACNSGICRDGKVSPQSGNRTGDTSVGKVVKIRSSNHCKETTDHRKETMEAFHNHCFHHPIPQSISKSGFISCLD